MSGWRTVAACLRQAQAVGVARLDAQLLLGRAVGRPRSWLLAHDDAVLDTEQTRAFDAALLRRAAGEPLAYVVGEKEFHGLLLGVDPRVLVPRPDTETLVDWAIERLQPLLAGDRRPQVIDLGTGSGAIALAVKRACPQVRVLAIDRSEDALDVARANAARLGLEIELQPSDWWSAVAGRRFDLALSNPPYVAEGDPHLAALGHEPPAALAAGADGLADLRRIVASAPFHLVPGGWLLLEHGHDQAAPVQALLAAGGFADRETRTDLSGHARCTGGRAGRPG